MFSQGTIPAKDLWNILVKWGERLSPREGELLTATNFGENILNKYCSGSDISRGQHFPQRSGEVRGVRQDCLRPCPRLLLERGETALFL